jgi:hypothetical protein
MQNSNLTKNEQNIKLATLKSAKLPENYISPC